MSIYSNITEKDLDNLRKLAQQQKEQRALKIKNRILKQTHDIKLAESLSPITKKLDETSKNLEKVIAENPKNFLLNSESQTPAVENITVSESLRDTLSFMKKSNNFFKLEQDDKKIFWNKIPIIPLGGNMIIINDDEFNIKPNIQNYFTKTYLTTKNMSNEDKLTIYDILKNIGFYSTHHVRGLRSFRMQDALYNLPREVAKIRNPPLPTIENESDNLQGEGVKIIIPSNILDIYTRLEVFLGLKLSGHTDTLTEASNLIDELYKRGEIQNKQQYQNALNKFLTN